MALSNYWSRLPNPVKVGCISVGILAALTGCDFEIGNIGNTEQRNSGNSYESTETHINCDGDKCVKTIQTDPEAFRKIYDNAMKGAEGRDHETVRSTTKSTTTTVIIRRGREPK